MSGAPLRVLFVATQSPWPPAGGGTQTLHGLLAGLVGAGVGVRVVCLGTPPPADGPPPYPVVACGAPRRRWPGVAQLGGLRSSFTLARYRVAALRDAVTSQAAAFAPHVVHLEQLQVGWLAAHLAPRVPVVLREQNVEHLLTSRLAAVASAGRRSMLRLEARLIAREEARLCAQATAVAAISRADAAALRALAPAATVAVLPAAWPGRAPRPALRLAGEPAFLCAGTLDWWPNRDGVRWLLREVWPRVRAAAPAALLHLAGPGSAALGVGVAGVARHPAAAIEALGDPRAVALVPVRAGSGVRMRLLAAWDAGMAAVTSPLGGEGLVDEDGDGAALAADAAEFAAAALRVAGDAAWRARLVAAGRAKLPAHAPARVAAAAVAIYRDAIARAVA